jgi:hypothetical protein
MYKPVPPSGWVATPGMRSSWSSPALRHIQELPGRLVSISNAGDPLEGIIFAYGRFQTHNGDNVPLGLWQDVAATIPAVDPFTPVAAWTDELTGSGAIAVQADPDKQPILEFVNGVPALYFDGIDDCMSHGLGSNVPASIFSVARHTASLAYRMIAGFGTAGAPGGPHMYSCLGPDPEWGGFYGANVKASTSLNVFKFAGEVVRAPNDVDFYTNEAMVNRVNGTSYDASNGQFIGSEAGGGAAFHIGYIGAILAGPATDYDVTLIREYLSDIYADVLGL